MNTLPLGVSKEAIALECLVVPILVEGVAGRLPNFTSDWYVTQIKYALSKSPKEENNETSYLGKQLMSLYDSLSPMEGVSLGVGRGKANLPDVGVRPPL